MWQRLRAWFGKPFDPAGPRFVIHRNYKITVPFAGYDPQRPFRIMSYLERQRLLKRGMVQQPRPASLKRVQAVHAPAYLRSLEEAGALTPILGAPVDAELQDHYLTVQRIMCGGTLRATGLALKRNDVSLNLGGGFHHAYREHGSGFCVFNDVAMAVASQRARGFNRPVLIVDLDLHDGDGTRSIFAEDPTVHTFSIHNKDLGDTDAVASTSIALGSDVEDAAYYEALRETLPPVFANVNPGLVIYVVGSDPAVDDRLGDWRITLEGLLARDRFVFDLVRGDRPRPIAAVLAGGYGPRAWRHGAALCSWLLTGNSQLEIPLDLELPVGHYRRLARLMNRPVRTSRKRGLEDLDGWGLSNEELGGIGHGAETLFLGRFSRHGIELALEETGLLERLRKRGYKEMRVELDLDDPLGHTLRITEHSAAPVTLFEVRLRVDRAAMPGRTVLSVEWLLIQDAGSRYELTRSLLPGQRHPGMGLLRDAAAALIVLCERLELDGMVFTPSHYHLARLARPLGRFLDPAREGWFQAVDKTVAHLHLNEAAAAVEGGRVADEKTGRTLLWEPSPLVIPVGADLKATLSGRDRRRAETEAAAGLAPCLRDRA